MTGINDHKQSHFRLSIVSTEATLFSGDVTFIWATGRLGELGIAPGHTPLMTSLTPGHIRVQHVNNEEDIFYVSGGMLEVQPYAVTVLADTAIRGQELDEAAAIDAKHQAEKALSDRKDGLDYSKTLVELSKAMSQLRIIERVRELEKYRR